MAISYMVKKAQNNKIVFTSAADIADYHLRKKLDMQEAYFFQPDYYFGYHNGVLPGNVPNMVEADTLDYLAVVSDKSMSPVYFFDYKSSWDFDSEDTAKRNIFGVIPSFSEVNKLNVILITVMPGILYFPVYAAETVFCSAICSRIIFKEELTRLQRAGILCGVAAIVMIVI